MDKFKFETDIKVKLSKEEIDRMIQQSEVRRDELINTLPLSNQVFRV